MKKILIVNNNMHIGGIQKSLVNLLNEISDKYDVTLFLFADVGELKSSIPKNVKVMYADRFTEIMGISQGEAKQISFFTFLNRSFWTAATRIFTTRLSFGILSRLSALDEEYDIAISFMQNGGGRIFYGGCAEFVLNSVKSKHKICFVHCDFLNYGGNNKYNRSVLKRFDRIAVVSKSVCDRLLEAVPELKGKITVVHNCCNYEEINRLCGEYVPDYTDKIPNLFTASRLSPEKGISRAVPIMKKIKDRGVKFVWRVAGDGPDAENVASLIKKYEMEKEIILLGNLKNPYPYFEKSDIVFVPSYNEAAPMVFEEARFFQTPVFTTETTSARELVGDTKSGFVCKNDDAAIENDLYGILKDYKPNKKEHIPKPDNRTAVSEFDELLRECEQGGN